MLALSLPCAVLMGLTAAAAPAASSAAAPSVDELIAHHIEAAGGLAAIKALKSIRSSGKAVFGWGDGAMEMQWREEISRPGQVRDEMTVQGLTQIDAYDGKAAWTFDPFSGRREAEHASADATKSRAQDADIEGPLVDWKAKGHKVEYLGTQDVDGTQARVSGSAQGWRHHLRLPRPRLLPGDPRGPPPPGSRHGADLPDGARQLRPGRGVWLPMSIEGGALNAPSVSHYSIEHIDANVDLPSSDFAFPAAGFDGEAAHRGGQGHGGCLARPRDGLHARGVGLRRPLRSRRSQHRLGRHERRISAVAADQENGKTRLFVGAASGGVWKSLDNGTTFRPVFDCQLGPNRLGSITIDPSHSGHRLGGDGIIRVRNSVSVGNGIYRSDDAGETWKNMGLPNSERIIRILVNPRNSDVVYACVPGSSGAIARTAASTRPPTAARAGSWSCQGANRSTGCASLAMDPKNPDVLLPACGIPSQGLELPLGRRRTRRAERKRALPHGRRGQHLDGADRRPPGGLPARPWGRVEVAIAPSDREGGLCPHRVQELRALPLLAMAGRPGRPRPQPDDGLAPVLLRSIW